MRLVSLAGLVLLVGCGGHSPVAPPPTVVIVPPPCLVPAPLLGQFDPLVPGYIVDLKDGVDAAAETARLGTKYGFVPTYVYTAVLGGFAADLTPTVVAGLRCERTVNRVAFDQRVTLGA